MKITAITLLTLFVMAGITYALSGSGGTINIFSKVDALGGRPSALTFDVETMGGWLPVGIMNETEWENLTGRFGIFKWNAGCGNNRCDPGENYALCPEECCMEDCTDVRDQLCHIECAPYCMYTVDPICDDIQPTFCADGEGECEWCEYKPCIDYSCTDGCVGSRWRSAAPIDNTCSVDVCSTQECEWDYTCVEGFASGCTDWQCDESDDCGLTSECSTRCRCSQLEVMVGSDYVIDITGDDLSRRDDLWIDIG